LGKSRRLIRYSLNLPIQKGVFLHHLQAFFRFSFLIFELLDYFTRWLSSSISHSFDAHFQCDIFFVQEKTKYENKKQLKFSKKLAYFLWYFSNSYFERSANIRDNVPYKLQLSLKNKFSCRSESKSANKLSFRWSCSGFFVVNIQRKSLTWEAFSSISSLRKSSLIESDPFPSSFPTKLFNPTNFY